MLKHTYECCFFFSLTIEVFHSVELNRSSLCIINPFHLFQFNSFEFRMKFVTHWSITTEETWKLIKSFESYQFTRCLCLIRIVHSWKLHRNTFYSGKWFDIEESSVIVPVRSAHDTMTNACDNFQQSLISPNVRECFSLNSANLNKII